MYLHNSHLIMDIFQHKRPAPILWEEQSLKKYSFIFIYGCLVFGGTTALVSSLLIELFYESNNLAVFFTNFFKRLCVSLPVLMLSGTTFGHWRWTVRRQKLSYLHTAGEHAHSGI